MSLSANPSPTPNDVAAVAARPEPAYSINLILMTLRNSDMARDIVEAGLGASLRHPGTRLTIAYGGSDPIHAAWLAERAASAVAQGAEVRLIRHIDIRTRLRLAFDLDKDWTLFLADDDPFSLNYLSSLARQSLDAGPGIATIAPTAYLGIAGEHTLSRRVHPLHGATAADRMDLYMAEPALQGVLYYALHRSCLVATWLDHLGARGFAPSYFDILLTGWCASHGDRLVVSEPAVQLRDESNWVGTAACVGSDARFYPLPAMTLFHELYWSADMTRLMRRHAEFDTLLPMLHKWIDTMLSRLLALFEQRRQLLGLAHDQDHLLMVRAVVTLVRWLRDVGDGPDFRAGLTQLEALADEIERAFLETLETQSTRSSDTTIDPPRRPDDVSRHGDSLATAGVAA
ncbi:MAG: hypothetical protein RL375_984 [Pseudomonadota bacterium]